MLVIVEKCDQTISMIYFHNFSIQLLFIYINMSLREMSKEGKLVERFEVMEELGRTYIDEGRIRVMIGIFE